MSPGGRGTTESVYSHSRIPFVIFIDVQIFLLCAVIFILCVCVCAGGLFFSVIYVEHALHSGVFPLSFTLSN